MIKIIFRLFGIKIEDYTREAAAIEILTRPVTFQYRPAIIEMDRKINELGFLNDQVISDGKYNPSSN